MIISKYLGVSIAAISLITASGCSDSDNDDIVIDKPELSFEVTVTNLTSNQPLSPIATVIHEDSYNPWAIGSSASEGLELLSESGDGGQFLTEADNAGAYASLAGNGLILPGESDTLTIQTTEYAQLNLSLATMLVNTNDAFAGLKGIDISNLSIGEEINLSIPVYDAGTEMNAETAGSIPGPADGGEGYNVVRDDIDFVARHPGVVSDIDGYDGSVLDSSHRFDGLVAKLLIRRAL